MHWLVTEQMLPVLHWVPQQGCVDAPHETQVLVPLQMLPELQLDPQQGCVLPPHATHLAVAAEQRKPAAQLDPGQHG